MINLDRLREYPVVAVDVESTGLYWYRGDKLFGVAIATLDNKGKIQSGYWDVREKPRILDVLRGELPHCKRIVNHAIKLDAHMLLAERVKLPLDRMECTMVRAALINEHEIHGRQGYDLDSLCKKYLKEGKVDIWQQMAALFGGQPTRDAQIKNLHRAPAKLVAEYAAPDPVLALKLWQWQEEEIQAQNLQKVWNLERRLFPVLVGIERQGVRVDCDRARQLIKVVDKRIGDAQRSLNKLAGKEVNANSAPQMRALFGTNKVVHHDEEGNERNEWRTDAGTLLENTDGGEASIDKDALKVLEGLGDKRAGAVLTLRRMVKCKSFLKDHILGHEVNGRVYPNYNQTKSESGLGTGTGRFSIDDPALQQIPMHDRDVAEIVRQCFLPETRQRWVSADWNQFEFRWFAHYVKDPKIDRLYEENPDADFHGTVAEITGITRDRKYAGDTANAKQINLGLVFGMGEGEMAYNMGMEYTTIVDKNKKVYKRAGDAAKAIFKKYHDAIPGVKALLERASSIARARGHVETAMGRHLRFPGGRFLHKAGGLVFQGTSADCMKVKMLELWPVCKETGMQMSLTVHDELDFSVPEGDVGEATDLIKTHMEDFSSDRVPVQCRIPIRSSISFGTNWWEASK